MLSRRQLDEPVFHHWRSVPAVVVSVASPEIVLGAGPREPDVSEAASRLRVRDLALRRADVARPPTPAPCIQRELPVAGTERSGPASLVRGGTQVEQEVPARRRDGARR